MSVARGSSWVNPTQPLLQRHKSSSSKRCSSEDSPGAISPRRKDQAHILPSFDNRLSSFDARLSLLELLHGEFQALRESLEFSRQQVRWNPLPREWPVSERKTHQRDGDWSLGPQHEGQSCFFRYPGAGRGRSPNNYKKKMNLYSL